MNGIQKLGGSVEDPRYIGRRFYEWLETIHRGDRRRPNKATLIWSIVLEVCIPGNDMHIGRANYERLFTEWSIRNRRQKGLASEPKALFKSALQQARKHAQKWPGFRDGDTTFGMELKCERRSLSLNVVRRMPVRMEPEAEKCLSAFYTAISNRRFEEAWEHLEPAYRKRRWQDDLGRFVRGYADMIVLQDLLLVPRSSTIDFSVIDAFFEEKRQLPKIPALSSWLGLTIGEARMKLPALLDGLAKEFSELGADEARLNALPFKQLFHADALTGIPWELGISSTHLEERYAESELRTLTVARRTYMSKESGSWLIKRITWLSS